ncbi:MAG TPA: hypothetical protein VIY52_15825 [Streptosporangiaceae bacterium]
MPDGPAEQAAATAEASRFPGVDFVIVGNAVPAANVTVLDGARSGLRGEVAGLITKDANAGGD